MNWSKNTLIFALLSLCGLSLVNCDRSKGFKAGNQPTPVYRHVVRGNPSNFIKGATLNEKTIFTVKQFKQWDGYHLYNITHFSQVDVQKRVSKTEAVEDGQEAPTQDLTKVTTPAPFKMKKKSKKTFTYRGVINNKKLVFVMERSGATLVPKFIKTSSGKMAIKVLHYSISKHKNMFSLLIESNDSDSGYTLSAFYFYKASKRRPLKPASKEFNYHFGPGVRIRWDKSQPVDMSFCGIDPDAHNSLFMRSVNKWQQALADDLKINVKYIKNYPPFSDLNNHCIYIVDDYIHDTRDHVAALGLTLTLGDISRASSKVN